MVASDDPDTGSHLSSSLNGLALVRTTSEPINDEKDSRLRLPDVAKGEGKAFTDGPPGSRLSREDREVNVTSDLGGSKLWAVKMDGGEATQDDFKVRVSSKREVSERLDRCRELLRTAMDRQPEVDEDTKRVLVQELLAVSDRPTTTTTTTTSRTLLTVLARKNTFKNS